MLNHLRRFALWTSVVLVFGLVGLAGLPRAGAQEKPEKAKAEKPKASSSSSAAATTAFEQKLQQWKDIIKQMRKIKDDFSIAEQAEAEQLRQKWNDLLQQGRDLIPQLRKAAVDAYLAAPNQDLYLTRFLVKLLADEVARDQYESAAQLAKILIDNDCGFDQVYNLAGITAFSMDQFDKAEELLKKAEEEDALDDTGKNMLEHVAEYKELWKEEQELRKKEAEADDLPRVKLQTTKGDIVLELFENEAPQTVGNFVNLVEKGFYDGLTFHRVLSGFMAQGGCPKGDGTGGPGYNIYCECTKEPYRKHFRGSLSMAHSGRNTGGSQFFITFRPTPHLNGQHTVFGRVIEGMEVLAKLQRRNPDAEPPLPEPDRIIKATVLRKRDHKYVPTKVED